MKRYVNMLKNKGKTKGFINIPNSLFSSDLFLGLPESRKGDCLAILAVLLRYADFKSKCCYPRLQTIKDMIGYSKSKIKIVLKIMQKYGVIKIKRLSSTNLYQLNPNVFYVSEGLNQALIRGSEGLNPPLREPDSSSINKPIELNNIYTKSKIDRLINVHRGNKDSLLKSLNGLSLQDFNSLSKTHPYYYKLALEFRKDLDHELKARQVDVSKTLERVRKFSNSNYRNKINYNKRNNIKPSK